MYVDENSDFTVIRENEITVVNQIELAKEITGEVLQSEGKMTEEELHKLVLEKFNYDASVICDYIVYNLCGEEQMDKIIFQEGDGEE